MKAYGVQRPMPAVMPPATTAASKPARVDTLVAGAVTTSDVTRPDAPAPTTAMHAFSLYTRAADKVEAAVSVQTGRTIDVTG